MREDFLKPEHRERERKRHKQVDLRREADPERRKKHRMGIVKNRKKIHAWIVKKVFAQYRRAQWAQLRKDFEDMQRHLQVA